MINASKNFDVELLKFIIFQVMNYYNNQQNFCVIFIQSNDWSVEPNLTAETNSKITYELKIEGIPK